VRLGVRVDDIQDNRVHLTSDEWIEAETIIWAAGIQAHDLTKTLGIETDRAGRLPVEPDLSLPGHPDIFAAGDIVDLTDPNGIQVPGLAPAASQMGQHIVKILKAEADGKKDARKPFSYWDKGTMAIIGKNIAVMQADSLKMKGFFAWLAWLLVHVLLLVGFRSKLFVLLQWAYAYIVNKPGARVFLNNPNLKNSKPNM
ncbi:MAG: FAD-dependent oxidoreductase, partial [Verrucomicrobiota bacterium]